MPFEGNIWRKWILILGFLVLNWIVVPIHSLAALDTLKYLEAESRIVSYPQPVQAVVLSKLSEIYYQTDKQKSFKYAQDILTRYGDRQRNPYIGATSLAHYILGHHYAQKKRYSDALDHFFNSEDFFITRQHNQYLSLLYLNIGVIYLENKDWVNAKSYLKLSYELSTAENVNKDIERCLYSLSLLYLENEVYDTARIYNQKHIELSEKLNPEKLAMGYMISSKILNKEEEYLNSNTAAFKGLSYIKPNTNIILEFKLYLLISLNYSYLNDNNNALYYMSKAGQFFNHERVKQNPSGYYLVAGNIYNNLKEEDKAKEFYYQEIKEKDRIIEQKNAFIQKNLHKQFFIYQQNKKIDLLQENNLLKEESLKRNRILLYGLTSLAALLIATSGIIIFMQREKFRNRRIISAQRAELTRKQYLEELHEAELKAATGHIQGQEKERERLAKELHDSIGGTLAGIKMELESLQIKDKPNQPLQQITSLVESTYNEVRAISHNFAIPDLVQGNFQDNLKNMIYNIPGKNGLQIKLSVYQDIKWELINITIKTELYRIIQESVANIIKHAEAKSADIQIVEDDNCLNITIEDDGKGFNVSNFKKGLGIRNIRSRIDLMNGTFDLDSTPNNGTFLYFNIPIISN